MKKFLSVIIALLLTVLAALPSFAAKSVKFTASDCETFAGDEFTVDIFISDYSQLKSATLIVEYDKNAAQFLDLNVGAIVTSGNKAVSFKDVNNSNKSYVQIDYKDSSASLSSAGKFLSLTFVSKDNAAGKTDIKLSVSGNKIATKAGSLIPELKNGKINIINNNPVTESTAEPTSQESSASEASVPEKSESSHSTPKNTSSVSSLQNTPENTTVDNNNKKKTNMRVAIGAVVTAVILIAAMLFETGSRNGKRKKKSGKSKKRRTGR